MQPDDTHVQFSCSHCGARLAASRSKQGRTFPCPKCRALVEVPAAAEADLREGYAIAGLDSPPARPLPAGLLDAGEREGEQSSTSSIVYSERPKLPRHPMVNGVFAFFPQLGTLVWACALVFGAAMVLGMLVGAVALGQISDPLAWIGSMVLSGIAIVSVLGWFIMASAFFLCVLQESAAGNKRIENWPDVIWVDWIGDALYLLTSVLAPMGVGAGVAWLCGGFGPWTLLAAPLALYLLFPIMLLSALEMQSPVLLLSPMVLRSMITSWKTWVVFYGETALLGTALCGASVATILIARLGGNGEDRTYVWFAAFGAVAAMIVAAQLTYFRLLGRLTWVSAEALRALDREEEDEEEDEMADEEEEEEGPPEIRTTPVDDF